MGEDSNENKIICLGDSDTGLQRGLTVSPAANQDILWMNLEGALSVFSEAQVPAAAANRTPDKSVAMRYIQKISD